VKLYEADGKIEFIYSPIASPLNSPSASVGLVGTTVGNFLSLNSLGTNPTTSSTTETATIAANPVNGQMYSFARPMQATTMAWEPVTDLYTDAAATIPYSGQNVNVVYVKPTVETEYFVTASNGECTNVGSTIVTPLPLPEVVASESVSICNGNATELSVSGANTYVWSPATGLSASTGNTVTANPTVTTTYTVTGTGANGCQSSDTVTVTVNNPVVITYLSPEQGVLPGQTATISVTATGTVSGYQWMMSDDEGATFVALEADEIFEGVTSNTLSINNVDFDFAGLQFQCKVLGTTPCGDATSAPYILKVNNVGIQTNPSSVSICEAGSTSFTTIATSPDETVEITYQWEMNTGCFRINI